MKNFDNETIQFLKTLTLTSEQRETLIEKIEWEKELSWSSGFADFEDKFLPKEKRLSFASGYTTGLNEQLLKTYPHTNT